ncbi:RICIN domain-containing protein [Streptomyces sp. NPDC004285]
MAAALTATQLGFAGDASAVGPSVWFRNVNTGQCLDAAGTTPGSWVIQYTCHDGANQRWYWSSRTDGSRTRVLKNRASDLCLSIDNANGSYGTPLVLWYCDNNWSQDWEWVSTGTAPSGEGMVYIYNPHYEAPEYKARVVDVPGGSTQRGARVVSWQENGGYNQMWTDHYE